MSIEIMQVSEINFQSSNYPAILREGIRPPRKLFVLGEIPPGDAIAIVGSRKVTDYGKRVTYQLAYELARAGLTIVSGLALGVDAIAHKAALEAGGVTIAVLGHGLDRIYPSTNRNLGLRILENGGALVSDYPTGTHPDKHTFPERNRIIAGLSRAVIITEADASSGSLITANFALSCGREVMAVPGNITSERSAGPNNLIKTGATPITSSADVLAALDFKGIHLSKQSAKADSAVEARLLESMRAGKSKTQELIEDSGLSPQEFAHVISLMEITGKVRNLGAGVWVAT
jgi:DNA processing protein